ncbi:MAG: zf-TFIIB domain-containing protein [Casimicrobiaceae bacterium]
MNCPGCGAAMRSLDFEPMLLSRVSLDFCFACRLIWFDAHESTELSPGGVLDVFKAVDPIARRRAIRYPSCSTARAATRDPR